MSITAKELAKRLGLSESAVSLALNDKPGVSSATRKRVFEAANQCGYDFARRGMVPAGKRASRSSENTSPTRPRSLREQNRPSSLTTMPQLS